MASEERDTLEQLAEIIRERRQSDPTNSYVAKLSDKGLDHILKKVGEEATETVIAAKTGDRAQIVYETADLWFHVLVMLAEYDLGPSDIVAELERRLGTSGIEEKASRKQ